MTPAETVPRLILELGERGTQVAVVISAGPGSGPDAKRGIFPSGAAMNMNKDDLAATKAVLQGCMSLASTTGSINSTVMPIGSLSKAYWAKMELRRLLWLTITPFGFPVEPEV